MLFQNKLHTKILENFQPKPTVEDKYGVHFNYRDLCDRLLEVQASRSQKVITQKNRSPNNKLPAMISHIPDKSPTHKVEKPKKRGKSTSLIKGRSKSIAPFDRNISPMQVYETSRKSQIIVKIKSPSHNQLKPYFAHVNSSSTQNLVKKKLRSINQNPIFKSLANNHGKRVII
jgi:hypothetical protein